MSLGTLSMSTVLATQGPVPSLLRAGQSSLRRSTWPPHVLMKTFSFRVSEALIQSLRVHLGKFQNAPHLGDLFLGLLYGSIACVVCSRCPCSSWAVTISTRPLAAWSLLCHPINSELITHSVYVTDYSLLHFGHPVHALCQLCAQRSCTLGMLAFCSTTHSHLCHVTSCKYLQARLQDMFNAVFNILKGT